MAGQEVEVNAAPAPGGQGGGPSSNARIRLSQLPLLVAAPGIIIPLRMLLRLEDGDEGNVVPEIKMPFPESSAV